MAGILGKRKSTFGIKVSEIPIGINEDDLISMFNPFGSIASVHIKDSQPLNHAFINYESEEGAASAASLMNGFNVPGGVLKVKLQSTTSAKRCQLARNASTCLVSHNNLNTSSSISQFTERSTSDTDLGSAANHFSVKISNVNLITTQDKLSELFKTPVIIKDVQSSSKKYAYANYKSQEEMEEALKLHDTLLDGLKIQVKIAGSSQTTSLVQNQNPVENKYKMSAILHNFFLAEMAGYIKDFRARGGKLAWENGYLQFSAPSTENLKLFQSRAVSCLFEDSVQLYADSWCHFASPRCDGSSLLQHLLTRSNKNVQVHLNNSTFEIIFVGRSVAVQETKQAIVSELCRVIPVNGIKLLCTLRMFPNLDKSILKDCGVKIQQFYKGSTAIELSGNADKFYESYLRITRILERQSITEGKCLGLLIYSAQERLSLENLPAVLCAQNNGELYYANAFAREATMISVFICGPWHVPEKALEILNSPLEDEIDFPTFDTFEHVKKSCDFTELQRSHRVYISDDTQKPSLTVQGYVRKEIVEVSSILSNAIKEITSLQAVNHAELNTETICYNCHPLFKPLMEKYIITLLQNCLRVTISISDITPHIFEPHAQNEAGNESKYKNTTITAAVESQSSADFHTACEQMKALEPQQKHYFWSKEEHKLLSKTVKCELTDVKKYYRVHIECDDKDNSSVIYGFSFKEVDEMEQYLRNCIEHEYLIEKPIKVKRYQSLYLQAKYKNVQKELNCDVVYPTDFQFGNAIMVLIGKKFFVDEAERVIRKTIAELHTKSLKFRHNSYGEMWKRKWDKVKREMEQVKDVVINVLTELDERTTNNPVEKGLTVEMEVIGNNSNAVCTAENEINSIGTTLMHKTKDLDKVQLELVLRGLRSRELQLREDYNTEALLCWDKLTVKLVTPNGSPEDLEGAYSRVMAYINSLAINREVVPLEKPSLGIFLQHEKQWQQILTIGKQHTVVVDLLTDYIDIHGETNDVADAKRLIADKIQKISELYEERKIILTDFLLPIVDKPMFEALNAKVRHDYDSVLSCKVNHSMQINKPDGSSLTIGIYSGNILDETSDAIVNIIDANTQNTMNLTEKLIRAGGPTIQKEYNGYVETHGPINVCHAICLGSGDLKCKKLFHVVPLQVFGSNKEILGLHETVSNILLLAEEHLINSISIPLMYNDLSALSECVSVPMKVILSLCTKGLLKSLKFVRFVLPAVELAYKFKQKLLDFDNATLSGTEVWSSDQYDWFWENDLNCFEPYSPKNSALLSKEFHLNSSNCTLAIAGNTYTIDFIKMLQINSKTSTPRRIEKKRLQPFVVWKYKDEGQWKPYKEQESQKIEEMWQAKKPSLLKIGKWKYKFDFGSTPMSQMNVLSRNKRPICREVIHLQCTHETSNNQITLLLVGPQQNLDKAEKDINEFLNSQTATKEISISSSMPADLVHDITTKHSVECTITATQIILKGLKEDVAEATMDIHGELSKIPKLKLPAEWEPQSKNLELKPLANDSQEWSKVSQFFLATMSPKTTIIKIERVQNKWLWEKYDHHSERMSVKNGGKINEQLLFHGTSTTSPSSIYTGEEGFDMRFSNAGMWGTGIYFAVKAKYSDKYAYKANDGTRQMFLAKVLTGDSIELPPWRDLRMPPIKEESSEEIIRYDTVKGITQNSDVYIAYSNEKVYPFYLITYT